MKTQSLNTAQDLTKKFDLQLRAILLNDLKALKTTRNPKVTQMNNNEGLMVA